MAECEVLISCIFFNDKMQNMPTITGIYKKKYCLKDNSLCARHMVMVACGKDKVPADLFPIDLETAKKVIDENKKSK